MRTGRSVLTIATLMLVALPGAAADAPAVGTVAPAKGEPCHLIASGEHLDTSGLPIPIGVGSCPGVRPGARVRTPRGSCTFNFLFRGSDGERYIGTAGHCILSSNGESSWSAGSGPVARDNDRVRIGEFAYALLDRLHDFALIRLDPGVNANPAMCHFGGPTGINGDLAFEPTVLHHFGQGLAYGSTVPGRTHLANTIEDPFHVFANGAAIFGDSGSGVISGDGRAIGVLVTGGYHYKDLLNSGLIGITRLPPQLARATSRLGITLEIETAAF